MKRLAAVFASVVLGALLITQSCQKDSPTTVPDPAAEPTIAPGQGIVSVTPVTPTAPTQPENTTPDNTLVRIDEQGNVTLYAPREWTACVYKYTDYQNQTYSHKFSVKEGFNPFIAGPFCGDFWIQVDVQAGTECPVDPWAGPFQGFKLSLIHI